MQGVGTTSSIGYLLLFAVKTGLLEDVPFDGF